MKLLSKTLVIAGVATLASLSVQADVLVANRFGNNVLKSDSTGLSGWTAFTSYASNARMVAYDGSNVFVGTTDNTVYSYSSSGGAPTGSNTPSGGGTGRLTFATGTTAFNGLVQAGSDGSIRRFGAAPVGAPISTTAVSWSPGAAISVRTISSADYLFIPGSGNSVRRFNVTTGTPVSATTLNFQGQASNFGQVHFFAAPNGDKFFGGTIAAGTLGGVYLDNTTNYGTVANGTTISGALADQKLTFGITTTATDPGSSSSIFDMAFDPYSDTGSSASFYILGNGGNRLYKYNYTYGTQSFALLGTSTGGTSTLAFNQGLQLAFTASTIPEPSTYAAIAGAVLLGFAVTRRRRQA